MWKALPTNNEVEKHIDLQREGHSYSLAFHLLIYFKNLI